jgi:hypothetical protein
MTQQDKDREAFEKWIDFCADRDEAGNYIYEIQSAWEAWQAARDHYAPKLTDVEVVVIACGALGGVKLHQQIFWPSAAEKVIAALRAAGARFKDSTDGSANG